MSKVMKILVKCIFCSFDNTTFIIKVDVESSKLQMMLISYFLNLLQDLN